MGEEQILACAIYLRNYLALGGLVLMGGGIALIASGALIYESAHKISVMVLS